MLIPDLGPAIVLAIKVMDYDLIGKDEVMGEYEMVLDRTNEEAGFLRDASEAFPLSCNLLPGRKKGQPRKMGKPRGELKLNVQYTPFFNAEAKPGEGTDGEDPAKAMEAAAVCFFLNFFLELRCENFLKEMVLQIFVLGCVYCASEGAASCGYINLHNFA